MPLTDKLLEALNSKAPPPFRFVVTVDAADGNGAVLSVTFPDLTDEPMVTEFIEVGGNLEVGVSLTVVEG